MEAHALELKMEDARLEFADAAGAFETFVNDSLVFLRTATTEINPNTPLSEVRKKAAQGA